MELLSRAVYLGSDGSPKGAFGRLVDGERMLAPEEQHRLQGVRFNAGGFHTQKEVTCLNGRRGRDIFLGAMSKDARNTEGKQKWLWEPSDPRQNGMEEPQYMMGGILALVHETHLEDPSKDISWVEVHKTRYLLLIIRMMFLGPSTHFHSKFLGGGG